jgi:ACDE family multidrug resistance protein
MPEKMDKYEFNKGHNNSLINGNLLIVFGITLISVLGIVSITPALENIAFNLSLSLPEVSLLITVFTIPGVIFTPVFGILADKYGRKKVLIPLLFLFGFAGGIIIFIPNFNIILILRFLQGIGAASLSSLNIIIIGDLYSSESRTKVMGYNAGVLYIGLTIYPAIGGALATLSWNLPFILPFIAIPIGILSLKFLDIPQPEFDFKFKNYLRNMFYNLKNRVTLIILLISLINFIILYGAFLTVTSFLSFFSGFTPFIIGLIQSFSFLVGSGFSLSLGKIRERVTERVLIIISFIIYPIAFIMVIFINSIELFLIPTALIGIAQGINVPSIQSLVTGLAPFKERGAIVSAQGMFLRLGQALGPFLMANIFVFFGSNIVFIISSIMSLLAFFIILVLTPQSKFDKYVIY